MESMDTGCNVLPDKTTDYLYKAAREDFNGDYLCRIVHTLMKHPEFDGTIRWLATKLGVSLDLVNSHMQSLVILSIASVNKGIYSLNDKTNCNVTKSSTSSELVENFKDLSRFMLNKFDLKNSEIGSFQIVLSGEKPISKFRATMRQALKDLIEESISSGDRKELYALSISAISEQILGESK